MAVPGNLETRVYQEQLCMLQLPVIVKALLGRAALGRSSQAPSFPTSLLPSCLLQAGFAAEGVESGTVFSDINLQEKDWTDYDEKAQESVGIFEVTHQFVKC